jgi:hypothetical protein
MLPALFLDKSSAGDVLRDNMKGNRVGRGYAAVRGIVPSIQRILRKDINNL